MYIKINDYLGKESTIVEGSLVQVFYPLDKYQTSETFKVLKILEERKLLLLESQNTPEQCIIINTNNVKAVISTWTLPQKVAFKCNFVPERIDKHKIPDVN